MEKVRLEFCGRKRKEFSRQMGMAVKQDEVPSIVQCL